MALLQGRLLLCIYKRQLESWDKGLLGQVFADDWGMWGPLWTRYS
jgi:hypothetical protein